MKSYWKWQLKNAIPFTIIVFALMALLPLISALSISPYKVAYCYEGACYSADSFFSTSSLLLTCLIPAFIAVSIAPIMAYSYRYSLRSVDVYYQASREAGYAKKSRCLIYGLIVLVSFSLIYWLMVLIIFLKLKFSVIPANTETLVYTRISFDYIWYLPAYFLSLLALIFQYGIASFFVSKGNNVIRSLFLLVLGEVFLALVFIGVLVYVETIKTVCEYGEKGIVNLDSFLEIVFSGNGGGYLTHNASLVMPIALIYQLFNARIIGSTVSTLFIFDPDYGFLSSVTIVFLAIYVLFGSYGIYEIFNKKEISGEYAGKSASDTPMANIIFHAGMGIIGFTEFASGMVSVISMVSSFISFGVIYFALMGAFYRNFRWNKKQYLPYFIVFGSTFLLGLIGTIITSIEVGSILIFY